MLYHYLASDKNGKIVEADFDADNVAQVLSHLAGKELLTWTARGVALKRS